MANTTPSVKSNKISKTLVAAVIGWGIEGYSLALESD